MTDLINKTIDELIEYCKEKNINYLTKAKKPMSKKTIISNLKKAGIINVDNEDDDLDIDTSDVDIIIRKTHNYLYKSSGIVGSKAQNDIMRVLIMRIFNILLLNNNSYLISILDDDNIKIKCPMLKPAKIEKYKTYIYDITNLLKEADIKNVWSNFIKEFISKLLDNIYTPEDINFNTPNDYDIIRLIKIISKFKITDEFIDDFFMKNGDIHETFLKYQGNVNSKELGQFFTPRIVIKSLLNECGFKDIILNKEGSDLSLCDLCMGTGGLLCYTYNYCKNKINPNKIYGCDIEKDTIKFGSSSLMLATNQYNSNIVRCNALVENPYLFNKEDDMFDIIIINPPFGTKTNYKSLNKLFNNYKSKINGNIEFKDIYPIVSNTGTVLFIQLIIYSLKKNGIACIILPDGELMTSQNNLTIRKYILDNCQILKIVNIQGGLFTNTGIKTKALFIQKHQNDNYNQEIEYIELNEEVKVLGKEKLNEKLQFNFNIIEEEVHYNDDMEIKTLGEVFKINGNGSTNSKDITNTGEYPFYRASCTNPSGTHNNYDFDGNEYLLIVKSGGCCNKPISSDYGIGKVFIVNGKCAANIAVFQLLLYDNNIKLKYLYYYLLHYQNKIQELAIYCTNNGNINMNELKLLKIPIPSIEKQNDIIEYFDMIFENVIKKNNEKIEDIKKLNKLHLNLHLTFNKDIEIKTLGEICDIIKGPLKKSKDANIEGLYPLYYCSILGNLFLDTYDYEDEGIIINKTNGSGKSKVYYGSNKYNVGETTIHFKSNNENVKTKYVYYYLNNNIHTLEKYYRGSNQKSISNEDLSNIKIPIPSLDVQQELIEYLDFNNDLIKTLEKENEMNKNNAERFMKQILYK
jgi:type I restriction-modification system DNA methylase subunit